MKDFLLKMLGDDPTVSSGRIMGCLLVLVGSGLCIFAAITKNTVAVTAAGVALGSGLTALGIKGVENIKKISAAVVPKTATVTDPLKKADPPPTPAPAKD